METRCVNQGLRAVSVPLLAALTAMPTIATPADDGPILVEGTVMYISDTPDVPDHPLEHGRILAISGAQWHALLEQLSTGLASPGSRPEPAVLQVALTGPALTNHVQAEAALQSGGRYAIRLQSGTYVFCLADLNPKSSGAASGQAVLYGCTDPIGNIARIRRLRLSYGEGGLRYQIGMR